MELVLMQRLTLRGHIIFDSQADPNFRSEFQKFVAPALKEGRLKYETDVTEGFENTLKAYNELFESGKVGKKLVKVSEA
jgi:NADPH-dependent curcumin reductase CurA